MSFTTATQGNELVHLVSSANGEYTLCGDAFDCNSEEPDLGWEDDAKPKRVTCEKCLACIAASTSYAKWAKKKGGAA